MPAAKTKPLNIILDCERMKYANTGLYQFCAQLGHSLSTTSQKNNASIAFYLPEKEKDFFGKDAVHYIQKSWHKFYNPFAKGDALWHGTFQGSMYYPKNNKQKKILTIHDLNFLFDENKTAQQNKKYLKQLKEKIDRSQHITAVSAFTLQCLQQQIDIGNVPCSVIYNGCNVPENIAMKQPSFISSTKPFLFSIGVVARKKNFHILIPLLKGNDFLLVIAGITEDENYKTKILEEAKKWNVAERIILPGAVSENEKWWLYANMKAFVFPSVSEGFGLPVIEAMYFDKPVILSKSTCLPEIGGAAAYYFNSFDPEEMRLTLEQSLQDYETEKKPGQIKQHAASFSWDAAAEQYWEVYKKVNAQ
jgi:glycosyltransferase involved in cell wall biosynthesis